MTAQLSPTPVFKAFDNVGTPLAYGLLTTYKAGTTIKQAAYVDSTQTTPLSNPVKLDFRGETPLWLDPTLTYKFVLTDFLGNTIPNYPVDNIPGGFGAGTFSFNIIPNPSNTFTLGNSTFSWANLYIGPSNAPVIDPVTGNIGYYARTEAEIAGAVTPTNYSYEPGPITDVRRYGYTADNFTLNDAAFADIIAVAKTAPGMVFQFPAGQAIISKALNFTNFGPTPIIFKGAGFDANQTAGTTVIAQTANDGTSAPGWIADFTGSQNVTIEEMNFYGAGANAAVLGFLFARSPENHFAQQIRLVKVVVSVGVSAGASALGSIAIANVDAEQFVDDHCSYFADTPYVGLLSNEISLVSPYSTIYVGILSHTITEHRQITYNALTNAGMSLYGVADSTWLDCVWAHSGANVSNYGIVLNDGGGAYSHCQALNINGQIEGFPEALTFNTPGGFAFRVKTQLLLVAPTGLPYVQTAAGYTLTGCELDNMQISNAAFSGDALACGAGSVLNAGEIMVYPNMTGISGSPINNGCRINYNGNGTGLEAIIPGANITSLSSPNAAQSYIDSEGFVHLNGILQSSAAITAGVTLGILYAGHRPNRTVMNAAFLSATGLVYYSISSSGILTIGTNISGSGIQLTLDGITFRQLN